eukprot:gb/GECG01013523.1/.p1 GENE.gb/GECG01013523.1/~~gb/GECG01013523.1/.p1  ORF type:complete len:367 (+),score=37.24 gb/GECG01013523.1/:1-1101(+)
MGELRTVRFIQITLFFHYYGMLVHQQNMLQDNIRTGTYRNAMISNPSTFKDAVVLDVGTGSGVLAVFAVQAGAKKVYAVEASAIADRARHLIEANNLSDKITVIRGTVEEIELPEKVDIVIAEAMGFLLVHEQMLQSYMKARDKFMKPNGLMFPTIGTIKVVPISDHTLWGEQEAKAAFWDNKNFFGLDLSCLRQAAADDHFSQPVVGTFDPSCIISEDISTYTIDFNKDSPESLDRIEIPLKFKITKTGVLHALGAWFDVLFDGNDAKVKLDTGPYAPPTHWYQCRLVFSRPLAVNASQTVSGKMLLTANKKYSYLIEIEMKLDGTDITSHAVMNLQDQQYYYLTQPEYSAWGAGYDQFGNPLAR